MVSCVGVSRVLLVVLNVLLFFVGAGVTVVGILVRFSPSTITDLPLTETNVVEEINGVINSSFVDIAAWVCIGFGVIIIVVAICGCVGSAFTKRTLLGIYICVVLQIIVFQLGIGIIIYLSPQWFERAVESNFQTHLNGTSRDISTGWDVLQLSVGCCGLNGTASYKSLVSDGDPFERYETCCTVSDKSIAVAQYLNDTTNVQYMNSTKCRQQFQGDITGEVFVNNIGCVAKIYETIQMLAIILIAVVAIEIFILVISCVVCCNDREEGKI